MAATDKKEMRPVGDGKEAGLGIVIPSEEEWNERAERIKELLYEWESDRSGYDEETWPEIKKALDEERMSPRRFFNGG